MLVNVGFLNIFFFAKNLGDFFLGFLGLFFPRQQREIPKQEGGTYGATADLEPKPTLTRGGDLRGGGDLV